MRGSIAIFLRVVSASFDENVFEDGFEPIPGPEASDPFLTCYDSNTNSTLASTKKRFTYSQLHDELIEEIVVAHENLNINQLFEIFCVRSAVARLKGMTRGSFAERVTRLRCVHGISVTSKIGPKEAKLLRQVYASDPNVDAETAQVYLRRNLVDPLPSTREIHTWLEYRKRIKRNFV